jgi:hypothetical protein
MMIIKAQRKNFFGILLIYTINSLMQIYLASDCLIKYLTTDWFNLEMHNGIRWDERCVGVSLGSWKIFKKLVNKKAN